MDIKRSWVEAYVKPKAFFTRDLMVSQLHGTLWKDLQYM